MCVCVCVIEEIERAGEFVFSKKKKRSVTPIMTTALPRNREYRDKDESSQSDNSNLDGDRSNFCLLLTLYMVQGFPIGLSNALPIILQSKKSVTYGDQVSYG